jgi:hypothetical protein
MARPADAFSSSPPPPASACTRRKHLQSAGAHCQGIGGAGGQGHGNRRRGWCCAQRHWRGARYSGEGWARYCDQTSFAARVGAARSRHDCVDARYRKMGRGRAARYPRPRRRGRAYRKSNSAKWRANFVGCSCAEMAARRASSLMHTCGILVARKINLKRGVLASGKRHSAHWRIRMRSMDDETSARFAQLERERKKQLEERILRRADPSIVQRPKRDTIAPPSSRLTVDADPTNSLVKYRTTFN